MKVVFFGTNGLGLGHTTRLLSIARAIRKRKPRSEILFITSLEATSVLFKEGFPCVKIPGKKSAFKIRWENFVKIVQSTVSSVLMSFSPDVIVVDTFESGIFKELIPVFEWRKTKKVFVFREQKDEMLKRPMLYAMLSLYDLVLIPHNPYDANVKISPYVKHIWTGPTAIRDEDELMDRNTLRKIYRFSENDIIGLVSFGGGGDESLDELHRLVLTAFKKVKNKNLKLVFLTGPLFKGEVFYEEDIKWIHGYYPIIELMPMVDFIITAGGYNTYTESIATRTPAIFWTFERGIDTQRKRVEKLLSSNACMMFNNFETLVSSMKKILNPKIREKIKRELKNHPYPYGHHISAEAIIEMVKK